LKQYLDTPYFVSESGGIFRDGKELSTSLTNKGYKTYHGTHNRVKKHISIHRAVATLYVPNLNNLPQVNHIDGDKLNNHYTNLEWVTNKQNRNHAMENGLHAVGINVPQCKLSEDDVKYIRENYIPKHPELGGMALSKKFGVGSAQISRIVNNKRWKHL
jgi:hypothetical protein